MAGKNIIQSIDDLSPRAKGELRAWIETWMRQHPIDATDNQGFTYGVRSEDIVQGKVNEGYVLTATGLGGSRWGLIPGMTDCVSFSDRVFDLVTAGNTLLGYWRLGEGAAPYADTSGLTPYDATIVTSGGYAPLDPDYTPGALPSSDDDGAVRFTGGGTTTGEYLKTTYVGPVADRFALNTTTSYNTVAVWVRPEANAGTFTAGIVNHWSGSPASVQDMGWRLGIQYPARTVVYTRKDNASIPTSLEVVGPALPVDTWTFVVAVYDSTGMTLFYDGAQVATVAGTQGSLPGGLNVLFGAETHQTGGTRYLPGAIDEVSIWDGPLTPTEIASLYTSGQPCTPSFESCCPPTTVCTSFPDEVTEIKATHPANSLLGYWRLGDGASPFADTSGHAAGPADATKVATGTAMTDSVTGALPAGDDDGAVQFNTPNNATGDWLHSGGSRFGIGNSDFTVAAFVYPIADANTFRGQIVGTMKPNIVLGAMGGYALFCDWPSRTAVFTRSQSGSTGTPLYANASGGVLAASTWSLVVGTFEASTQTQSIYVNGVLAGTGDGSVLSIGDESNTISIGRSQNPPIDYTLGPGFPRPGWFYGGIDEVMIWTVALSSTEVSDLYTAGLPCVPSTPDDGKVVTATGSGSTVWSYPTVDVGGTRFDSILAGTGLAETDNSDGTVTLSADPFDPSTATSWWFPLVDSDGTCTLDGDGALIPTLIPL